MGITLTPDEERSEAFHNSNGEDRKLASWDALELCWEIEKIPASERQTVAAVSASRLRKRLLKEEGERVNGTQWIAVQDRLPEDDGPCLTFCRGKGGYFRVSSYQKGLTHPFAPEILFWRELPPAPSLS